MGILLWIVTGIVMGSAARFVMPGPPAGGLAMAIPIAIGGALVGGLLGVVFNDGGVIHFDLPSLFMAIFGALIVMLCYRSYALRATY